MLRRGGKLNIHLIIGVQDKQVKTMVFEGQGDLRRNFTSTVEVRADRSGRRWATVTTPADEEATATYEVPKLPNLEGLIEAAPRLSLAAMVDSSHATAATVISREMPAAATVTSRDMPENATENLRSAETSFPASAGDGTISEGIFSFEEIVLIAAMIARGGKGKTEIVQAMPGYSGRKHKVYSAYYDRVREAVELLSSEQN